MASHRTRLGWNQRYRDAHDRRCHHQSHWQLRHGTDTCPIRLDDLRCSHKRRHPGSLARMFHTTKLRNKEQNFKQIRKTLTNDTNFCTSFVTMIRWTARNELSRASMVIWRGCTCGRGRLTSSPTSRNRCAGVKMHQCSSMDLYFSGAGMIVSSVASNEWCHQHVVNVSVRSVTRAPTARRWIATRCRRRSCDARVIFGSKLATAQLASIGKNPNSPTTSACPKPKKRRESDLETHWDGALTTWPMSPTTRLATRQCVPSKSTSSASSVLNWLILRAVRSGAPTGDQEVDSR